MSKYMVNYFKFLTYVCYLNKNRLIPLHLRNAVEGRTGGKEAGKEAGMGSGH